MGMASCLGKIWEGFQEEGVLERELRGDQQIGANECLGLADLLSDCGQIYFQIVAHPT